MWLPHKPYACPRRPFRTSDPLFALKVLFFPLTIAVYVLDAANTVTVLRPLVFVLRLPVTIVVGAAVGITKTGHDLADALFHRKKLDAQTLERYGAIVQDGVIVGRRYPMRPLTLLLLFAKLTAVYFTTFFILYVCFLFARWVLGLEAAVRASVQRATTSAVTHGTQNFVSRAG